MQLVKHHSPGKIPLANQPHHKMTKKSSLFLFCTFTVIALSLTACSLFGKYGEVEYNNLVVEKINETSLAIENTATLYNETIPDVVTEKDTFDTTAMRAGYETALDILKNTNDLLDLEGSNVEQQNAVRSELQTYMTSGDLYLQSYSEMLTYYSPSANDTGSDGTVTYKDDITKVTPIDEILHTNYTTFIESNNDLVDTLESFLKLNE